MPILIETDEEFRTRHGDSVYDGRRFIFEDGAVIDNGNRKEPPAFGPDLQTMKYFYVKAKTTQLENKYNSLRNNIKVQAEFHRSDVGPPPHPDAIDVLRALANEVIDWKMKLEDAEKLTPLNQTSRLKQSIDAEQRSKANEMLDKIQKLPSF